MDEGGEQGGGGEGRLCGGGWVGSMVVLLGLGDHHSGLVVVC